MEFYYWFFFNFKNTVTFLILVKWKNIINFIFFLKKISKIQKLALFFQIR